MASTNPFERPDTLYHVLLNPLGQHSLWPVGIDLPDGWTTGHGPAPREQCRQWVDAHWAGPVEGHPVEPGPTGGRDDARSQR